MERIGISFLIQMDQMLCIQNQDHTVKFQFRFSLSLFTLFDLDNCSCGTPQSLTCNDSLIIKNHTIISGMCIGCLPITSLRLSTLECFYNQTCLNEIKETLNLQNMSLHSLDPFASSQYLINTTLNYIIDRFMLEKWANQINYTQYFDTCNLEKCTYSTMDTKNPLAICTNLLGLCKKNIF